MPSLYVLPPSYALTGPQERGRIMAVAQRAADLAGYTVVPSPLLDRHMAGWGGWLPAAERISDLLRAIEHDAVWACKGGYGAVHAVPVLLAAGTAKRPLLIGYSDATVLHAVWRKRGWGEGLYGHLGKHADGREEASATVLFSGGGYSRDHSTDAGARVLRAGRAEGPVFAACLSVLARLVGTGAVPDLAGHLLFVEDVDEKPFQIDHAFEQLHQAGHLAGIRAIVGGVFPHQERNDYLGPTADEILAHWGTRLGVPVLSRLPFGHLDDHLVIPCGRQATLDLERHLGPGRVHWRLDFHPRQ